MAFKFRFIPWTEPRCRHSATINNGRRSMLSLGSSVALGFILLAAAGAWAQHCPFDGSSILVVEVKDAETQARIEGLRLTIVDQNGDLVVQETQERIGSEYIEIPLVFIANPPRTDPNWEPYQFKKIRYSFAGDNYILPLRRHQKDEIYVIKIEDIDGEENGSYPCSIRVVQFSDYFPLCGNVGWPNIPNNPQTLPPKDEFDHTISIQLKRRR